MYYRHQTVSVHFVRALLSAAPVAGLSVETLLHTAQLNRAMIDQPQLRITAQQFSRLVKAFWLQANDEFMALSRYPVPVGTFTLMAKYAVHCRTLEDVYRHLCHFYNLVSKAITLEFSVQSDKACLTTRLTDPELDQHHLLVEVLTMFWHRFPSWLIGKRIPLTGISFAFAEPRQHDEYSLLFPCPRLFATSTNSLFFDAQILDAPIIQTPETLRAYLRRAPLDWFSRQDYFAVYTRKVIACLQYNGHFIDNSMEEVAQRMHITSRTLRRKLAEEKTRFQVIKDTLRRDTAIHYLSQPSLPVATIADKLAFSDPAAFSRAFKTWTGVTPSLYRRV